MANFIQRVKVGTTEYDLHDSEFIVDTRAAAGGAWTGASQATELFDGMQITFWLNYPSSTSSSTEASLALTLADGSTTAAKPVYLIKQTRVTLQFAAGSLVKLTYRVNPVIDGVTTSLSGWWVDAGHDNLAGCFYVEGSGSTAAKTSSPYYAAQWRGNNPGITELYSGLCIYYKLDVAGNGSYGTLLSINGGAAHPVVVNVNTMVGTRYAVGCVVPLVYDAVQTATAYMNTTAAQTITGCWKMAEYDSNTITQTAYRDFKLSENAGTLYRYQICLVDDQDGLVPYNNVNNAAANYTKAVNTAAFDPFRGMYWYGTTTAINPGEGVSIGSNVVYGVYQQDARYSFNLNSGVASSQVAATNGATPYAATYKYALGSYCTYLGELYKCKTAITTAEAWNASKWTLVANYESNQAYAVNTECIHDGYVYKCSTAIGSGGEDWNESHWTLVTLTGLISERPVYIKAKYNKTTRTATLTQDTTSGQYMVRSGVAQGLPTVNPNTGLNANEFYIYIFVGYAYTCYNVGMFAVHPIYYWNERAGKCVIFSGVTEDDALPAVSSSDNGKVLKVVNGDWAAANEDEVFTVNCNLNAETFAITADKTYTQISAAITAGKKVQGYLFGIGVDLIFTCSGINEDNVINFISVVPIAEKSTSFGYEAGIVNTFRLTCSTSNNVDTWQIVLGFFPSMPDADIGSLTRPVYWNSNGGGFEYVGFSLPDTAVGSTTQPVYWDGSSVAATSLATVAATGSYNDLTNKPTIPSAPGTLNTYNSTAQTVPTTPEALSSAINLHKISKTGSYNDLLDKPTIDNPVVITCTLDSTAWTAFQSAVVLADSAIVPFDFTLSSNYIAGFESGYRTKLLDIYQNKKSGTIRVFDPTGNSYIEYEIDVAALYTSAQQVKFWGGSATLAHALTEYPVRFTIEIRLDMSDANPPQDSVGVSVEVPGGLLDASMVSNLATVATSGSYTDLIDTPTIPIVTSTYSPTGTDAVNGTAVAAALATLPTPMQFKGSVGSGGTIEWANLPAASSSTGFTYKVITDHSTAPICKVGDTIISNGTNWIVIPSGDEPSGTVTSVGIANGGGISVSGSPITSSGTITISHADTSSQASVDNSGRTYIQDITLDTYGHVTGLTSATETAVGLPTVTASDNGKTLKVASGAWTVANEDYNDLTNKPTFTDVTTTHVTDTAGINVYTGGGIVSQTSFTSTTITPATFATVTASKATAGTALNLRNGGGVVSQTNFTSATITPATYADVTASYATAGTSILGFSVAEGTVSATTIPQYTFSTVTASKATSGTAISAYTGGGVVSQTSFTTATVTPYTFTTVTACSATTGTPVTAYTGGGIVTQTTITTTEATLGIFDDVTATYVTLATPTV